MEGWVGLCGWLHTEINVWNLELNLNTVTHLSTNRSRPMHYHCTRAPLHHCNNCVVVEFDDQQLLTVAAVESSSNRESSVELIKLDVSRTFPQLCIFQQVGQWHVSTNNHLTLLLLCYLMLINVSPIHWVIQQFEESATENSTVHCLKTFQCRRYHHSGVDLKPSSSSNHISIVRSRCTYCLELSVTVY